MLKLGRGGAIATRERAERHEARCACEMGEIGERDELGPTVLFVPLCTRDLICLIIFLIGGASPCSILGAAAAGHRPWADKEAHRTAVKKRKHMNTCPATKRPARSEFLSCEQTRGIFKQP